MTDTDKNSSTKPASPSASKPDAARRALLRGLAVGVPSIVTLASGSAWGAAGSIPCFNGVYQGNVEVVNGNYVFKNPVPPDGSGSSAGDPVTQANTSQFCWNSGGPTAWENLPASAARRTA